jgi:F0F1-type ATP synthase gamma subunit
LKQKQIITENIAVTADIKNLCHVYEEISVLKMQDIKEKIITARNFFDELSVVYQKVKDSYHKNPEKMQIFEKNKKKVSVLISANSRLFGRILRETCELFVLSAKDKNCDLVIIGELGAELIKNYNPEIRFTYFFVPDASLENFDFTPLLEQLIKYKEINVFYGFYQTLFTQKPISSNITGDATLLKPKTAISSTEEKPKFLFEPNLKKILMFFEKNIISSLFLQTVYDSYLSRLASRVSSMEESIDKIIQKENLLAIQKKRLLGYTENKKQMERLAGMSLWE